jgi:hypothetical protein
MKKLLSLLIISALVTTFYACSDDETPNLAAPSVTAPSAADVQVGTTATLDFAYTAAAGFASSTATATGGTVTVDTDGTDGATSGTISVTFTAGANAAAGSVTVTVTDKEGDSNNITAVFSVTTQPVIPNEVLSGLLDTRTLTNDRIYELAGRVIVPDGKVLTIQEGTIIKGREGNGALASALIISRGAKIEAVGTADEPIIFTSILDNIKVGEIAGTNLDKLDNEKWGGLIILGKAPISAKDGDTETAVEGLPADEAYGLYGGNVPADDSGTLKYVSIRHGGTLIGEGNEINGLTLGGVGSGTEIDHVEIFATLDDGVEFFGGTVNVTNLLVYWQGDDGVDIDMNYSGTVTNFMVYHGDGVGTDEGLEIDGPENSTYKDGKFTLKDGTIVSDGVAGSAADIKADAQGTLQNLVFSGYSSAKLKFEGEYTTGDCTDHANKVYSDAVQQLLDGVFVITGTKYGAIEVYSKKDSNDVPFCASVPQTDKDAAAAKATSDAAATGATASEFAWTMAAKAGLLN